MSKEPAEAGKLKSAQVEKLLVLSFELRGRGLKIQT